MKAFNLIFLVSFLLCTSSFFCASALKGKQQQDNSVSINAQVTINPQLEDSLKSLKNDLSTSGYFSSTTSPTSTASTTAPTSTTSTTSSPSNAGISISASSPKCLNKFKNLIDKLPVKAKNILIAQFQQNTNPNGCCNKASVIQAIANEFNQNELDFADLLTVQSRNSKSAFGCFRGGEIAQAQTGGLVDAETQAVNQNRVKALVETTNQMNSNIAKCLVQVNLIALENIGMMCEDEGFVSKVYDIDSSGIVIGPKKSQDTELKIFENCSQYVNTFQLFSDTVVNQYIDGVNYLTGLDQCNYFSNFFTFDQSKDQSDSLNSKKEISNYTKTELLNKWYTCSQGTPTFNQSVASSLKDNFSNAQTNQPNGLSTYIGRSDINFDVIRNAFSLSDYPAFQIHCENSECQAYCTNCANKIWDSRSVVTSSTTKLDVSCCDKVCIVWVEIQDYYYGTFNYIPGAEIFYISGDQFFSDVNKLTATKINNANTCIQNTIMPDNSFAQTAQFAQISPSTQTVSLPIDSSKTNTVSSRQFSNQVLRQKLQNVVDNAQNMVMDVRLNSALLLKVTVDKKTQTLMDFLYGNMYAKNNTFYLECTNGKCKFECDSCGDKEFALEANTDTDPENSYQANILKAKKSSGSSSSSKSSSSSSKSSSSSSKSSSSSSKSGSSLTSSSSSKSGSSLTSSSSSKSGSSLTSSSSSSKSGSSLTSSSSSSKSGSSLTSSSSSSKSGSSPTSSSSSSKSGSSLTSSKSNYSGSSSSPSTSYSSSSYTGTSYNPFSSSSSSSSKSSSSFGFGSSSSVSPSSFSSHYTPSYSSSSSYSTTTKIKFKYNPVKVGYYNSYNYVNVYNPYKSYDYLYYNNHYGYGYNGYYSGYNPYYYSPPMENSYQGWYNIAPEYDPADWVIYLNKPFSTNEYVKTLNGHLANISIYSQCCKLFCVIYIDPIEDGVNSGGAKRVYVNITTKSYAFIDPTTVSFTQKTCLEQNLAPSSKSSTLAKCQIKYPYDLIPIKDQCLTLMTDQCKNSNFDLLVSRVSLSVKTSDVSQNICTPPLSCVNLPDNPPDTDKQKCGATLYSLFLDNGITYSYSTLSLPCVISSNTPGSSSFIQTAQTGYVDTNTMSDEQKAKYSETKILAENSSNKNILIDGSTSTAVNVNSEAEASAINDAVEKQLEISIQKYSEGRIFSPCAMIIFLGFIFALL